MTSLKMFSIILCDTYGPHGSDWGDIENCSPLDVTPSSLVYRYQHFRRTSTYSFSAAPTLKLEAADSSGTLVPLHQTTWHHISSLLKHVPPYHFILFIYLLSDWSKKVGKPSGYSLNEFNVCTNQLPNSKKDYNEYIITNLYKSNIKLWMHDKIL